MKFLRRGWLAPSAKTRLRRFLFPHLLAAVLLLILSGCAPSPAAPAPALPAEAIDLEDQARRLSGRQALRLQRIVTGLDQPVGVVAAPDGSSRLFVVEKGGIIRVIESGEIRLDPFLDISAKVSTNSERGLLGLAFEPDRAERFYVNYTDLEGDTVIARYTASDLSMRATASSEEILIRIEQPAENHNGGNLVFGPDGYLWIGMGDGGFQGDRFDNGQNRHSLLGSLLRIDVSGERGYRVPPDNPYSDGEEGATAVWALGLRNPWRFSFDRLTEDLWLADVGHLTWEEINHVSSTMPELNFGWPIMEGADCYRVEPCDQVGLVIPVAEIPHGADCSIIGGSVYRGKAMPAWQGHYFFGDFCSGRIRALPAGGADRSEPQIVLEPNVRITSFGEDLDGELLITTIYGGLYRLVPR